MLTHAHTPLIGRRYALQQHLGQGNMGTVYRAVDRLTGQSVALKQVLSDAGAVSSTNTSTGAAAERVALAHEFQTLASLHHPHVIQVLDYGFDDAQMPYFTMTLLDSPRTLTEAAQDAPIGTRVRLLIEVLQALAYLHRRGVVHCDLKPDNALVTRDGQVRVLDFGLAALRGQAHNEDEISGTLAYMAPEVLQGQPPSVASDLYAVGIIAHELLLGRHPFDLTNAMTLINDTLYTPVVIAADDLEIDVSDILERLLNKSPELRYQDAYEVIDLLSNAFDLPAPEETSAIRESFLQAAQFVGREEEMRQLGEALKAATDGQGSAWLVGGENGVGKSRLLDELRIRALVQGVLVLRGQGVLGGGLPYQFWREPLRRLLLAMEVDDLEAGILKDLIPDIETLLDRPVPEAIALDGSAYQQRLSTTIVSLFRRYGQPLLLILEDLQWASESLGMLKALAAALDDLPMMLVCSYRYEERPALHEELPELRHLRLERLRDDAIEALSVSMLGAAGHQAEVLQLLKHETEGNVYFLVEVVRALAEEAGRLSDIGQMSLPRRVFAGGIREVMTRRLNRVPESERPLLALAAVVGRELDLAVLEHLKGEASLSAWLTTCANCAVLELQDGQWRFAHDKLREALVAELSKPQHIRLHRQVAEALELVYPYSPQHAAILAHHWQQAEDYAHALQYIRAAGQHALHVSALEEATAHFERALDLLGLVTMDQADATDLRADLLIGLSEALKHTGHYSRAIETAEESLTLNRAAGNRSGEARALLELAEVAVQQGEWTHAIDLLDQSHALFQDIGDQAGLARTLNQAGLAYAQRGDYTRAVQLCEDSMHISRTLNDLQEVASTANNMGVAAFRQGDLPNAARYFEESLAISRASGERLKMATTLMNLGSAAGATGDLALAQARFEEALDIARAIGARRVIVACIDNLGVVANMQQQYDLAEFYFEESLLMARAMGNLQAIAWSLNNLGHVASAQGNLPTASLHYRDAARQAQAIDAIPTLLEALVGLAQAMPDAGRGLALLAAVLAHPAITAATRKQADDALAKLRGGLPDAESVLAQPPALDALLREVLEE